MIDLSTSKPSHDEADWKDEKFDEQEVSILERAGLLGEPRGKKRKRATPRHLAFAENEQAGTHEHVILVRSTT